MAEKIDPETQKILQENGNILDLINHPGWHIARQRIVEKILSLQTVAEYADIIQTGNATKLLKEMKANARSAEILFDFLRQLEGDAQASVENKPLENKNYIVNLA